MKLASYPRLCAAILEESKQLPWLEEIRITADGAARSLRVWLRRGDRCAQFDVAAEWESSPDPFLDKIIRSAYGSAVGYLRPGSTVPVPD
jgi:hypothetical protein